MNIEKPAILSKDEMKKIYGTFYLFNTQLNLDEDHVPQKLRVLLPYAEFWGIADDWKRENMVQQASREIQQNLKAVITLFDDDLDEWLAGNEASTPAPSKEYIAFSAMRMAADFVF